MRGLLATWLISILLPGAMSAAETNQKDAAVRAEVNVLIGSLGSESFRVREAASKKLQMLGDRLLFEPGLDSGGDLSGFGRFHNCFIVPLSEAGQNSDPELEERATQILRLYCDERPLTDGAAGWALYAVHRLLPDLPPVLTHKEMDVVRRGLDSTERERIEFVNNQRKELRRQFRRLAVIAMARDNPRNTTQWLCDKRLSKLNTPWGIHFDAAIAAWARDNFDAALAWSKKIPGMKSRVRANSNALAHTAFTQLIRNWPKDRPIAQATTLLDLMEAKYLTREELWGWDLCEHIVNRWVTEDVDGAIRWVNSLPSSYIRGLAAAKIVSQTVGSDLDQARKLVAQFQDAKDRDEARREILSFIAKTQLRIDEDLFSQLDYSQEDAIVTEWKRRSPEKYANLDAKKYARDRLTFWILTGLAKKDHQRALDHLNKLVGEFHGTTPFRYIAHEWARRDVRGALRWARTLPQPQRDASVETIARIQAETDPHGALQVAGEVQDGYWEFVVLPILPRLAETNAVLAMTVVDEGKYTVQQVRVECQWTILWTWAENSPVAAAHWAATHDGSWDTGNHVRKTAEVWARQDSLAAAKWALSLEDTERRAFSLLGIAEGLLTESEQKRWIK